MKLGILSDAAQDNASASEETAATMLELNNIIEVSKGKITTLLSDIDLLNEAIHKFQV